MTKTEVVNQFYVSLAKGDFEKVSSLLSDDLVWHQPGKGSLSGTYEGKEAVFSHLGKMSELSGGTFAIDQIDYITENNNLVAAAVAFEVFAFDKSMRMRGIDVYRVEDDKIQEVWLFSERIDEEDAFWTETLKLWNDKQK